MAPTSPLTPGGYSVASSRSVWDPTNVLSSESGSPERQPSAAAATNLASAFVGARVVGCGGELPGCEAENALYESPQLVWEPRSGAGAWLAVRLRATGAFPRLGLGRDAVRCVGWQPAAARAGRPTAVRVDASSDGDEWRRILDASSSDDSAKAVLFDLRSPLRLAHEAFVRFTVVEASGGARPALAAVYCFAEPAAVARAALGDAPAAPVPDNDEADPAVGGGPAARRFLDDSAESLARKIAALRVETNHWFGWS